MQKLLLLLLIIPQLALAKSIFGSYHLLPVQTTIVGLANELEAEFQGNIDPTEFNKALNEDDYEILNGVKAKTDKNDYEIVYQNYLDKKNIDLLFKVRVDEQGETEKVLSLNILNSDKQIIFQRKTIYDYRTTADYMNRLTLWVDEFKDILPPIGEVVSLENGKVQIKIIHDSMASSYKGRPFHIGSFQYDSDYSKSSYKKMGAVTDINGKLLSGYIYADFRDKRIYPGDHLIFLNSSTHSIKNREKVLSSETWFNYLNSPKFSLLDCTLLPLVGNQDKDGEFYKELSNMVTKQKLCKYRNDKQLNKLLSKYQGNFETHLMNEVVLKNIAQILRVGALFRLGIYKVVNGISVNFDVVSENGKNIYYSKYTVIEEFDQEYIAELLLGWIIDYKRTLPLTGRIVQIRGSNLLIDIPSGLVEGTKQEFEIIRPISLKYEEFSGNRKISWKNKTIAYGNISSIKKHHSVGNIFKFATKDARVKEGDWVFIKDLDFQIKEDAFLIKKHNLKSERGIGEARALTEVTSITTKNNIETMYSLGVGLNLYLPFGFLFTGEASKNVSGSDQSISNNNFLAAIGYSFTPRLYDAYLSFVDLYFGQRTVNYQLNDLNEKGIGNLKYQGLFAAAKIEIPIYKKFALQGEVNYVYDDQVSNTNSLFGEVDNSTSLGYKLIGKYKFDKESRLFVEYQKNSFKSRYNGVDKVIVSLDSQLIKLSYGFNF